MFLKKLFKKRKAEQPAEHIFSQPIVHQVYGKMYMPYYNLAYPFFDGERHIYSANGIQLKTFFLRDFHSATVPFWDSNYFIWDRFNFGLNVHFYSHNAMLETMGKPTKRFGFLVESEAIVPQDYHIFETHPGLHKDFDAIFTYSDKILDKIPNAKFVPFNAQVWDQDAILKDAHLHKTKNISFICSHKQMCPLHTWRYNLALQCKQENLADTFGTFDGGPYVAKLPDVLNEYRFNICLENDITPYYFTERFTTALACQTIPVYLGASKIGQFFNPDGIIQISQTDDVKEILTQCTEAEYQRRLPAVLDNYNRVQNYLNILDFMYENYLRALLEKSH